MKNKSISKKLKTEDDDFIRKQGQKHYNFIQSITETKTAFGREFLHPKTKRRITWNERCSLIEKDFFKRTFLILERVGSF